MDDSPPFVVIDRRGSPKDLVDQLPDAKGTPLACFIHPRTSAVVLGSRQSDNAVDTATLGSLGVEWTKRRSGGGAVFVAPDEQVWLDVFLPCDDARYENDVSRSAWWLGELWADVLQSVSHRRADLAVHRGPMHPSRFSTAVCFSGYGPGEVLCGDKKIVGISQRRSRQGAWFFSMAMRSKFIDSPLLTCVAAEDRRSLQRDLELGAIALDEMHVTVKDLEAGLRLRLSHALSPTGEQGTTPT